MSDRITDMAQRLHQVLNDYIAIHNDILGSPWHVALRRILPIPWYRQRIAFAQHASALAGLADTVRTVRHNASALQSNAAQASSTRTAQCLDAYSGALHATITELQRICEALRDKEAGAGTYRWPDYQKALKTYEQSRRTYSGLGESLNRALNALPSGPTRPVSPPQPPSRQFASISAELAAQANPQALMHEVRSRLHNPGSPNRSDEAREALLDLCVSDAQVQAVMASFGASRGTLLELYWKLNAMGAAQWVGSHWVAASALAYPAPLRFLLSRSELVKRDDLLEAGYRLVLYFRSGAPLD